MVPIGQRADCSTGSRQRRRPILHFIFSAPCVIVITRFLWPLHLPIPAKAGIAVLLLIASQYHYWSKLSSGSVFAPEFPRALIIVFTWAFGAIAFLAVLQLLLDASTLLRMPFQGSGVGAPDSARYAIALLAVVLAAVGVQQAIKPPPLKDVEFAIRDLPPQFDGYKMLQLTDLHISRLFPQKWASEVVARSNALGADLIVVTGDFIDGSLDMRRADVEPLRGLRAPDGVYMIPGNHEYFFGYRQWMAYFTGMGMRPLENSHAVLNRDGGQLVLAGVTDASARATGNAGPDLAAALNGAPSRAPVILLDHQPRNAPQAAARGIALQLSGHTHGGMVVGLNRLVARANAGFVSGRYQVGGKNNDMTLYVNNGTALWPGFALRLGVPAELTRITLRRAP